MKWYIGMLKVFRPSFEVVKEGRIILTEKLSLKYYALEDGLSIIFSRFPLRLINPIEYHDPQLCFGFG